MRRGGDVGFPISLPRPLNDFLFEQVGVLNFNELNRKAIAKVAHDAADQSSDGERRANFGFKVGGNRDAGNRHVDDETFQLSFVAKN